MEPVNWDELDTAINEVLATNDPMQGRTLGLRMDVQAVKMIENITKKLSPSNSALSMARFWLGVGCLLVENRHNKSRIVLPYA